MTPIVFCDVAGTLVEGNPWDYIRQHDAINQARSRFELMRFLPVYFGKRLNVVSDVTFRHHWLMRMAGVFSGVKRADVRDVFRQVVFEDMAHLFHDDVAERLKAHQAQGRRVVLVSGIFTDMIDFFAERVGADDVLGTRLAYDANGVCVGRVDGETCVGPRKLDFINAYLANQNEPVALSECYGYADSYSDVALLSAVGHSFATYPDPDMRTVAQAQGWEIIPA